MAISVSSPPAAASVPGASFKLESNGIVVHNNGHFRTVALVAGGGVEVGNQLGISGNPSITAPSQRTLFKAKAVDCTVVGDAAIMEIAVPGARYFTITDLIVTNATATPVELRAGLFTKPNGTGVALVPGTQDYGGLLDDLYVTKRLAIGAIEKRATPFLYFRVITANVASMEVDIYVLGDILEMEL